LKNKKASFLCFLKSRREDYEISPQFRTQIGDGYDFFASVRDGVSIQHAFRLTNLVVVLVLAAKAPWRTCVTRKFFNKNIRSKMEQIVDFQVSKEVYVRLGRRLIRAAK
jgi:hypothetical protein